MKQTPSIRSGVLLTSGQTISARYLVKTCLGRGGMATVYRAFDPKLNLDVALKVLPAQLADEPTFVARFRREGQTLAKLSHPHILRLFEIGEDEASGLYFLVLEFLTGGTLKQRITGQPWPVLDVLHVLAPIASAIDYAHRQQPSVVHRDLKPANIMFNQDGEPVVSDFGIARLLTPDDPERSSLSFATISTGQVLGTPAYMAPEQAEGKSPGPAADMYSLGVIAYELLVGVVPFNADTPLATLIQVTTKPLPLPTLINPALSTAVEQVLLKALSRSPEHRFATATEFMEVLDDAMRTGSRATPLRAAPAAQSAAAQETVIGARRLRSARRVAVPSHRTALGIACLTVLVLTAGGLWSMRTSLPTANQSTVSSPASNEFVAPPEPTAQVPPPTSTRLISATASVAVTPSPSATATATPPATPTVAPTLTTDQRWDNLLGQLASVWGTDWPKVIALVDGFRAQYPEFEPAQDKLYAALVFYGHDLAEAGQPEIAVAQLLRAQALLPDRDEAQGALLALTPTPVPQPTLVRQPPPVVVPARNVPAPAAPSQASPPEPVPVPTKVPAPLVPAQPAAPLPTKAPPPFHG